MLMLWVLQVNPHITIKYIHVGKDYIDEGY